MELSEIDPRLTRTFIVRDNRVYPAWANAGIPKFGDPYPSPRCLEYTVVDLSAREIDGGAYEVTVRYSRAVK